MDVGRLPAYRNPAYSSVRKVSHRYRGKRATAACNTRLVRNERWHQTVDTLVWAGDRILCRLDNASGGVVQPQLSDDITARIISTFRDGCLQGSVKFW